MQPTKLEEVPLGIADSTGAIWLLTVNGGNAMFSNINGLMIGGVSVTNGGDGGTLKGVVLMGAVAVSGEGAKLSISDSSGAISRLTVNAGTVNLVNVAGVSNCRASVTNGGTATGPRGKQ